MQNYEKMYTTLFQKITEVVNQLQEIQQQTEEMYIEQESGEEK